MRSRALHLPGPRSFAFLPRRYTVALTVAAALAIPAGLAVSSASAAVSCRVDYTVTSQWPGGFVANVTIANSGDAVNGWTLAWTYGGGQQVTSAWNATITQSGSAVTARDAGYNASIASGASTSFGFLGTINGTTNPAPSGFTLNGTACGNSDGSSPTPSPTTPSPTASATATPTPTPTPTYSKSPTASWAQCSSDQWAQFTDGAFTLYNNIWGSGAGTQQLCMNSHGNWQVTANHPDTGGVKSYPNASLTLNRTLSSMTSLTSSFDVTVPGSGSYATTYDLWADNNAYEVMVWMNKAGAVGPIADSYDSNGAVPSAGNVSVGGHTWNIYRGSNGSNAVYSFIRTSNTTSGTVDLLALLNWLTANGWWGDVTLGAQQFGYEITSSNGGLTFTTNSYDLSYN